MKDALYSETAVPADAQDPEAVTARRLGESKKRMNLDTSRKGALSRRSFLCGGLASFPAIARVAARRQNIVFILVDDLGWTDFGCFGSPYYETRNIDRLAGQGMKFTAAYSCGPNCSPSRSALMSGQYPARNGVTNVLAKASPADQKLLPPKPEHRLPLEHITIAEVLKRAGYETASIGKWHLGDPPFGPEGQGFDLNVGGNAWGQPGSYFYPFKRNAIATPVSGKPGDYLTDRLTDEAIRFMEKNRANPFFLYLPQFAVHTPHDAKPELVEKYKAKKGGKGQSNPVYAAMVESVDQSVGRVMAGLDELGLAKDTVVILTSDNGGVTQNGITSNAPLRGGKGMLYEGGIRVPAIVRWPGRVSPGSVCEVPVSGVDFYPTLVEISGAKPDPRQTLDGLSLVPLLEGGRALKRDCIYWHFPHYLLPRTTPAGAIRQGDYKLIEFFEDGKTELYNLGKDIGEAADLSAEMPAKAAELRANLHAWRKSTGARMPVPNPEFK